MSGLESRSVRMRRFSWRFEDSAAGPFFAQEIPEGGFHESSSQKTRRRRFALVFLTAWGQAQTETGKAKVNINSAGLNELQKLPRIGPKLAQRILDYRKEHGPFKRPEDLLKVKGIGEKMFLGFKDQLTVGAEAQTK